MTRMVWAAGLGICLVGSAGVACGDDQAGNVVSGSGGRGDESGGTATGSGGSLTAPGGASAGRGSSADPSGGSGSGDPPLLGTLFTEDFENGATKWTVTQGICSIEADDTNVFTCVYGTNEARALAGDAIWSDYTVSARVKLVQMDADRRIYLAGRFTDSNNWYGAAFYNAGTPAVQIRKKVGGTSSDIAGLSYPFVLGQWYKVAFKMSGSQLTLSIDDVIQLTAQDTQFARGQIALLVDRSQVSFDDVLVTSP
jgi:hypothetical protein